MPQKILCKDCNTILYEGYETIEPQEIISRYNSQCPKCSKKLVFDYEQIEVFLVKHKVRNIA